jgi:hypothetical protein
MKQRWLIAHRKGVELPELNAFRQAARTALADFGNDPKAPDFPEFVLGVEDYEEWFESCGGWDAWALHWAIGTEVGADGGPVPRYTAIVLPDRDGIKKATGRALELALRQDKPVFWFDLPGEKDSAGRVLRAPGFYRVREIVQAGGNEQWPIFSVLF